MRVLPILLLAFAAACGHPSHSQGLSYTEIDLLSEDVHDVTAIVFQTGENAYLGDVVYADEILEEAQPGNGWTVTYALDPGFRLGFGPGLGRVRLSLSEDGAAVEDPLAFSFAATDALDVLMFYEIVYEGETLGGRATDVAFEARVTATRSSLSEPFLVEYWIAGDCWLGATLCRLSLRFFADGPPSELRAGVADGAGFIDDPDVRAEFDIDYDFFADGSYVAEGWVGCCSFFRERFTVPG